MAPHPDDPGRPTLPTLPTAPLSPERARFFADVNDLELRLAIIDDRFDRLASRPDEAFQSFRVDTLGRMRSIALRAREFEQGEALEPHHRRRVAALLVAIRHRVGALEAHHARFLERRPRLTAATAG